MTYAISNNKLNYSLLINGNKSATSIIGYFYTNNANKISVLAISYIIIEPLFGAYYFFLVWFFPGVNLIAGGNYNYTLASTATFNMTGTISIWKTIVGVDVSMSTNN